MKSYKQFVSGIVIGALIAAGGTAFANSSAGPIITNWVKYKFNGEEKPLPSGYTTLNYEGHTYVPTRFIAEELGAEVKWDVNTNSVLINKQIQDVKDETDDKEKPEEVINDDTDQQDQQDEQDEDKSDQYDELPVSKTIDGVRVEVYSVEEDREYTKFYVVIKNTTDTPVQLDQGTASFTSDFDTYANKDIKGGVMYWKDTTWFKDLNEDDETEGYIMLPPIPKDEKQGKFYVEAFENGLNGKTLKYEFDIKW